MSGIRISSANFRERPIVYTISTHIFNREELPVEVEHEMCVVTVVNDSDMGTLG